MYGIGKRDNSNGAALGLNQNDCGIENRAGSTHPRTEHRPMGSSLMLSMVPDMFYRLGSSQSTDGENTEDK